MAPTSLLTEEHAIFKEHESRTPRYDIFATKMRTEWLGKIFSLEDYEMTDVTDAYQVYFEELLLSLERNLQLAKLYMASSICLLEEYGRNYNMPDEIMNSIKRHSFIAIAEANSIGELRNITLRTTEQYHEAYKKYHIEKYSYPISQCMEIIYRNRYEKITLSMLAEQVHMNPSYLSRKFHSETGQTIMEYVTNVKMEEADVLIKAHLYSLEEIAELFSYDRGYFRKVYRKWCHREITSFVEYQM